MSHDFKAGKGFTSLMDDGRFLESWLIVTHFRKS